MTSRVAAAIVGLEGVAAVVTGFGFAIAAFVGHPSDRGTAVLLGVLLSVYGAGIMLTARGIARGRRWARTPAFLVQFFALVVVWYNSGSLPAVTAIVSFVAAAAIVALALASRDQSSASRPSRS